MWRVAAICQPLDNGKSLEVFTRMERLLVTGASGTLGRCVATQAMAAGWYVIGTYRTAPLAVPAIEWHYLEIADRDAVEDMIEDVRPAVIVHTAFLQRGTGMWPVTVDGAAFVALAAQKMGARLVHISSDALLGGRASPHDESARPYPLTPYGAAKAAAETAVSAILSDAAIVRTSLIIRREPADLHSQMVLDIIAGNRIERLFTDTIRCPIAVEDLASAVLELAESQYSGIINVAGADAVSRYELGQLVARAHGLGDAELPGGTMAERGLIRPDDVRLDMTLARRVLRTRLRGIREYLGYVDRQ